MDIKKEFLNKQKKRVKIIEIDKTLYKGGSRYAKNYLGYKFTEFYIFY